METSIFMDKAKVPNSTELQQVLGKKYDLWIQIRNYVFEKYPKATEEWNLPGAKYGWSFRIKDKKRAIIYLLPRVNTFIFALVFGEKATQSALNSSISDVIKKEIESAPVYAEGRGFRMEADENMLKDIKLLIDIKLDH